MSLNSCDEVNTKKLDYFMVDNKQEPCYDRKHSAYGLKTVQLLIFELSDSIYFIFNNIFSGVFIKNLEDVLV